VTPREVAPDRDRDAAGRARNGRGRDELGRPTEGRGSLGPAADRPALPPTQALRRGQELLDAGRPFEAHEVFEAVWKATADPERGLWRGLAQLAVGITQALRGNDSGARSLLARTAATLAPYAATQPYGVDVDGLRTWAETRAADPTPAIEPPRLVAALG
jgi:uncharacterized protein